MSSANRETLPNIAKLSLNCPKPKVRDSQHPVDTEALRCEPYEKEMRKRQGAPSLHAMAMRQMLETYDGSSLSELPPVMLASMSKSMWTTIKALNADANRWRLMRKRACLLDRRMLDGPYRIPQLESKQAQMDREDGFQPQERLAREMDEIADKWTVIPYSDSLQGPDEKKEHVVDSTDFYVELGRVHRTREPMLCHGQRRWEKEISAQLLLYRLCLIFQQGPTIEAGAWLFVLRSVDGAEVWFADRGNLHWFMAVCPDKRAQDSVIELLELLISDRCVIRYSVDASMDHPTAGETIGAAWSR